MSWPVEKDRVGRGNAAPSGAAPGNRTAPRGLGHCLVSKSGPPVKFQVLSEDHASRAGASSSAAGRKRPSLPRRPAGAGLRQATGVVGTSSQRTVWLSLACTAVPKVVSCRYEVSTQLRRYPCR